MRKIICSACLMGVNCKFDGGNNANPKVMALAKENILVPVCPEQLGGLPTPRPICRQREDKVFNKLGEEVTQAYNKGAQETLMIAKLCDAKLAVLKQKSPSCGAGKILSPDFSNSFIPGYGVTAKLLKDSGIKVISEEDL